MVSLDLQNPEQYKLPATNLIKRWIDMTMTIINRVEKVELTIRFVGEDEGLKIAKEFCQKHLATNVLSFSFEYEFEIPVKSKLNLLGDLVICMPIVRWEAINLKITTEEHLAHLCIHGTLHLLGFDHQIESEAKNMEIIESSILEKLGYADPYKNSNMECLY